ncbi:YceI family protein [Xanthomonas sp. XNM01]|uniref:YceI family protein n=1 Tax=Xanthomonas sp. XNM01 TaxID=2769289 RepID=UPI001CE0DADB|nr:YceI family protein [Xanthomonas sp. XNM01]
MVLALAATAASAAPARYELDPVHTRVVFAVEHAGFSQALGAVSGSEGVLEFDPDDWSSARLDVRVPLQRLDLGDEKWNRATLARNLLDAEQHPQAHFVSTRIEPVDAHNATVHGRLSLRGVTRDVALQVRLNAVKRHPLPPFRRTVGFSATAELSRSAFGIDAWPSMIGDTVQLRIEAEAVRRSGDAIDAGDDAPPDATTPCPALPDPPQPVPEHTP